MSFTRTIVVGCLIVTACGGSTSDPASLPSSPSPAPSSGSPNSSSTETADASSEAAAPANNDGTATRVSCTSSFGNALTTTHGRLDGYLVSVVPESGHACNGDTQHIHLQVKMNDAVYDVAVNVDGLEAEVDAPLPGEPWSEGWHSSDDLDYVNDFKLHSSSFTLTGLAAVRQRVTQAIASANHVAIFTTGYGPSGGHLVHRQGSGRDGAIVIDPLGPKPHVLAFRFDTQSF